MLANIYQVRCKRCKRVATVCARIKPVTVTFTPKQAGVTLAALFFYLSNPKYKHAHARHAFALLDAAIKQQTQPRRKSQ